MGFATGQHLLTILVDIQVIDLGQNPATHSQLVVTPQPAEQPKVIPGDLSTRITQRLNNLRLLFEILVALECQAGQAKMLVYGETGAGCSKQDLTTDLFQSLLNLLVLYRRMPE